MNSHKRYIGLAGAVAALVAMSGCGSATSAGAPATTAVAGGTPTTAVASAHQTGATTSSAGTSAKPAPTPTGKADLGGFYSDLAERNVTAEGYLGPIDRGGGLVDLVWKNPTPERRAQVEQMAANRGLSVEFLNAMMSASELQAVAERMSAAKADLSATYGWEYGGLNGMSAQSPTVPRIEGHQTRDLTAAERQARDDAITKIAGTRLPIDEKLPGMPAGGAGSPSPSPSR